ncbi:hypothetical protein OESDEN_20489 [Oesophagostomum dentatum]|uniref:Uncharacterized protein n=1 Tax=Oesophagostomum dentatum TaxID=61180 RepID=A0A0B1S7G7_OESDE|nr:hypothetical protein OESDEN_20489 [Oesophagostomum dentatum]
MQDLSAFDPDEPYMAVIGPSDMQKEESQSKPIHSLVVASRGAMTNFWANIHSGDNGCSVTSLPDLCFADIVQLNLKEDAHERSRFIVLERHFSKFEMIEFADLNGHYNDGAQMLGLLSGSLLSAHNLTVQDFRIIDLLINKVKVIPKLS